MRRKKNIIITEEEKRKLRDSAIVKEYNRLKQAIKDKTRKIKIYKTIAIASAFVLLVFIYLNEFHEIENKRTEIKKKQVAKLGTPSENKKIVQKTIAAKKIFYYNVYFKNDSVYPLAQFTNENLSTEFCSVIQKMDLPETVIKKDSIRLSQNNSSIKETHNLFVIQLGAFKNDILNKYSNNFIGIVSKQDQHYFKYQIGPFKGYRKCIEVANRLELNDGYILNYR